MDGQPARSLVDDTSAEARPRLRRLFRFSLRTLLLAMLVVSVWLGWYVRGVKRQQEGIAAVTRLGGWTYYDYQMTGVQPDLTAESRVPAWLLERTGADYFHDVVSVNAVYGHDAQGRRFDNNQTSDEILSFVECFPKLESLALHETQASDEAFAHVGRLERLRELVIWNGKDVTDEGVRHLASLESLEGLHLSGSRCTDEALAVLAALPSLERLSLQENNFTDTGLANLRGMRQLRELWVGLGKGRITDAGLLHLANLSALEQLDLQGTYITNDGLDALKSLKNLREIHINQTQVTDATALQKALPNCVINGLPPVATESGR